MKKLKHLNAGQPTSIDHFNALVDVINILLRIEQVKIKNLNYNNGSSHIKFSIPGLDEIINKYPGMFEDAK